MGLGLMLLNATTVRAEAPKPVELEGVRVDEHLDRNIDLNLEFTNERGYQEPLKNFFHAGRPVMLNLVYYTCPMLCNLILNGQTQTLRQIPWTPGNQFEIVTISINPAETFDLAQKKKAVYLSDYGKPAPGWHFLSDYQDNAKKLATQLGDYYHWDERGQQFAHQAVVFILSPTGKICRYLYGIHFKPRDVRLALTEASDNQSSLSVDRLLLFCFHYDPTTRSYVMFATNFMRAGGVFCVLLISLFIWRMVRAEKMRRLAYEAKTPVLKGHLSH
jgi:protein SCO1/2